MKSRIFFRKTALTCGIFIILSGCTLSRAERDSLSEFVRADTFPAHAATVHPSPSVPNQELLRFARTRYADDSRIRSELAFYFLRYDNALLKRGLLTVDARADNLIGALWDRESIRKPIFRESPSSTLMRDWIRNNQEWFALSNRAKQQLAANDDEFSRLQTCWKASDSGNSGGHN